MIQIRESADFEYMTRRMSHDSRRVTLIVESRDMLARPFKRVFFQCPPLLLFVVPIHLVCPQNDLQDV